MYKEPRFRLKNGDLTVYSFMCGYVQSRQVGKNNKEIYMEHRHYHVRSFVNGQRTWDTFDWGEVTKVRKHYRSIKLKV